ncbi:hypothetical protein Acr_00g0083090 [Actinidia rufa]|uniref:Uncharacterized protein n=1 Tax=Actinidia rufa TaxID=165716 RepID=A0A7J0DUT3_9ERIC|nr:hypothetical protein Acr_00g0083090 [Actinidia rufa]
MTSCSHGHQPLPHRINIPAVEFITTGVAATSFSIHTFRKRGLEYPFPEIQPRAGLRPEPPPPPAEAEASVKKDVKERSGGKQKVLKLKVAK